MKYKLPFARKIISSDNDIDIMKILEISRFIDVQM